MNNNIDNIDKYKDMYKNKHSHKHIHKNIHKHKLFFMYEICINQLSNKNEDLCYDLIITNKYKNIPWTF